MATARDAAVRAQGLARRFGDLDAVAGIDLEVEPGEIYGFLGPNGAGKSTVVRMLTTLLAPTAGRALVGGVDVVERPGDVRFLIGVALQEAGLDKKMTGREVLVTQGRLFGLTRAEIDRRIDELSPILDMPALDRLVGTYSGGMARRLDVAAGLVHNPKVLFLDEPTTGLDPPGRVRVWEEVRRLNEEMGMTLFLTTQYLEEADELADRVGIIDAGKLVAEGTPADLKRSIGIDVITAHIDGDAAAAMDALAGIEGASSVDQFGSEVRVSATNGGRLLSPVALALDRAGVSVRELAMRTPTLDDVFLDVTGHHLKAGAT
jgi:ABC-2 type transport system ATP-binding protein